MKPCVKFYLSVGSAITITLAIGSVVYAGDLHNAARGGDIAKIEMLLNDGGDINESDRVVGTPLHYAAARGAIEVAQFVVDKGADLDVRNKSGSKATPIHLGAANGHAELVSMLLKSGASIDSLDSKGKTALHDAAVAGQLETANVLIENGADVNIVDIDGNTSLHHAARFSHLDIVKLLVENGSDVNALNQRGHTPLVNASFNSLFIKNADSSVLEFLVESGAVGIKDLLNMRKEHLGSVGADAAVGELERLAESQ